MEEKPIVELSIVSIKIEDKVFLIEEGIDFEEKKPEDILDKKSIEDKRKEGKTNKQILIDYYTENPQELLPQLPNQKMSIVIRDTMPFELKSRYKELLGVVFDELGFQGHIKQINFNNNPATYKVEYEIYIKSEEKIKEYNKTKCANFEELILVKHFEASTKYGKVSHADIPKQVLKFTPKEMNLRIINKLLGNNDNVTYICFSEIIYKKFTDILNQDESGSLPNIDISKYVQELEDIAISPLFREICTEEYPQIVTTKLEHLRNGNFAGASEMYNIIENILRNIARKLGCTDNILGKYLVYLSLDNSKRRLLKATNGLIVAIDRNNQAHGSLPNSDFDQKYFAILNIKAIRDIYLDYYFFQSLDLCFSKMALDLHVSKEDIWNLYPYEKPPNNKMKVVYKGDWKFENRFEIILDDLLNKKKKEKFIINIDLIKKLILSYDRRSCNENCS